MTNLPDDFTAPFTGQRARWRDREWTVYPSHRDATKAILKPLPGEAAPDDFAPMPGMSGPVMEVDPGELTDIRDVEWIFTWRGRRFKVIRRTGDTVLAALSGVDDDWARDNGLNLVDRGWAQGEFALNELRDLHLTRRDKR